MNLKIKNYFEKTINNFSFSSFKKFLYNMASGYIMLFTVKNIYGHQYLFYNSLLASIIFVYFVGSFIGVLPGVFFEMQRDHLFENTNVDSIKDYIYSKSKTKYDELLLLGSKVAFYIAIGVCLFLNLIWKYVIKYD